MKNNTQNQHRCIRKQPFLDCLCLRTRTLTSAHSTERTRNVSIRSADSEEQPNSLSMLNSLKVKRLAGHREHSNCYFSGKGELWIRKYSTEFIKPGAKGSAGLAYDAIFALRSSEATSFMTWFILGSITREA